MLIMKVLAIGFGRNVSSFQPDIKPMGDTTPFGYDTIIINPVISPLLYGQEVTAQVTTSRWKNYLQKWFTKGHRIIVLARPHDFVSGDISNYGWLPDSLNISVNEFVGSGSSPYLGSITTRQSNIRTYLSDSSNDHRVVAHFDASYSGDDIAVNSQIDSEMITSFTYKTGTVEIIFVPTVGLSKLEKLVSSFETSSNRWTIPDAQSLEENIAGLDDQIKGLEDAKHALQDQIKQLNEHVQDLITTDIYLGRAVSAFEAVQGEESPEPEKFYEALEAVENAFNSEREMREELGFSKTKIGTLTRRTNEFRHVAKSGQVPNPLTVEEIQEFTSLIEDIISAYIAKLRST